MSIINHVQESVLDMNYISFVSRSDVSLGSKIIDQRLLKVHLIYVA